jgi:hypothetical protein
MQSYAGKQLPTKRRRSFKMDEPADRVARDKVLFAPLPATQRAEILRQVLSEPKRPPSRRWPVAVTAVGLGATLGLLLFTTGSKPLLPDGGEILELADDVTFSLELVGGAPGDRSAPTGIASHPGVRLPAGRPFRANLRIPEREVTIHQVVAHCGGHEKHLSFFVLAARPGLLEAEIHADLAPGEHCELELQIEESGRVLRLPRTSFQRVEFIEP